MTGYLKSHDQTPIFYRHYEVENQRATVILIHGLAEHSGRYAHVIDRLRKEKFGVLCIDLRGHGHSKGQRGDIRNFENYEEDVKAAIKFVQNKQSPKEKIFIVAHSMGALVCLKLIAKMSNTVDGLVLSSPLFAMKMRVPIWKRAAARLLSLIYPGFGLRPNIKGSQLTSDTHMAKSYDNDPLVIKKITARAILEVIKACESAQDLAPIIKHPFFMQVSGRDFIVDSESTSNWFKNIHNKDATIKLYPEFLHEIYNESRRNEAIDDFINWLKQRS